MTADDLLRAVIANPADDARRMVYADYLQSVGDPQGELIAVQCALAKLAPDAAERAALEAAVKALLDEHAATWTARLGDHVADVTYRRGLAYSARAGMRPGMLDVLDRAPIRDLGLRNIVEDADDEDDVYVPIARELAVDPRLARIELLATGVRLGEAAFTALFRSEHLGNLCGLQISDHDCQPYAGRALAAAHLPSLEVLALCGDWAAHEGDACVAALATANLPALRDLALLNLECTDAAAIALARSPACARLTGLDFGWGSYQANRIGADGARALATFTELRRLVLDFNPIGDAGLIAFAESSHLQALRSLSLKNSGIGDAGLVALAASAALPQLETLELTFNREITHAGISALAESPRLATLSGLWLRQISLGPPARVRSLVRRTRLRCAA